MKLWEAPLYSRTLANTALNEIHAFTATYEQKATKHLEQKLNVKMQNFFLCILAPIFFQLWFSNLVFLEKLEVLKVVGEYVNRVWVGRYTGINCSVKFRLVHCR